MSVTPKEIKHVANLARLYITSAEIENHTTTLSRILDLVDQMQDIDTDGVEPMSHPKDARLRMRADKVTETNQREEFQQIAPEVEHGLYLVPKVLD